MKVAGIGRNETQLVGQNSALHGMWVIRSTTQRFYCGQVHPTGDYIDQWLGTSERTVASHQFTVHKDYIQISVGRGSTG